MQGMVRHSRRRHLSVSSEDWKTADHALIALAPTALFYVLDAYYLMLERRLRKVVRRLCWESPRKKGTLTSDLYAVTSKGSVALGVLWSMFLSFSVLPFYFAVDRHGPAGMAADPVAGTKAWQPRYPRHKVFISFHERDIKYKEDFVRMMGKRIVDRSVDTGNIDDTGLKTATVLPEDSRRSTSETPPLPLS